MALNQKSRFFRCLEPAVFLLLVGCGQSQHVGKPDAALDEKEGGATPGEVAQPDSATPGEVAQPDSVDEVDCANTGTPCEPLQVGAGRCKREIYWHGFVDHFGNSILETRTRQVQLNSSETGTRSVLGHLRSESIYKPLYDRVVVESTVGVAQFGMSYSWLEHGISAGTPLAYNCGGANLVYWIGPEWERDWIQSDDSGTLRGPSGPQELDPPCCGRTQCNGIGESQAECSEDFVLIWSPPEGAAEPAACVRVILLPKQDCSGTVTVKERFRERIVGMTCYTDKPVAFAVCFNGAKPSDYGWSEPQVDLPELTTADVNPEWPKF